MMRKWIRKRYRIRGLGVDALFDALRRQGCTLYDIRRIQPREYAFSIPLRQCGALEALAAEKGFELKPLPDTGLLLRITRVRKKWLLIALSVVFLGFALSSLRCIWTINVLDAGAYQGEVNAWLRENGVKPFIPKRKIDLQKICDGILYRLPKIAWVRAEISGVTLRIQVTQGVFQSSPDASQPGDIVADSDGIIQSIRVYAGTAAVKPGDTVKKGQILIRGEERTSGEGQTRSVHAQGSARARIWRSAEAAAPASQTVSTPTGRVFTSTEIASPWLVLKKEEGPDWLTYDCEAVRTPLGGVWFPVWIERNLYSEVSLEKEALPPDEARMEAGRLAMRKLLDLCGKNDEMIDKFLIFCMIEGDTIQATATAELVADIGAFRPRISDY